MYDTSSLSSPSQQVDAIVVGGGISGLAIAHSLGRKGKKVHLLENSNRLGGAVHSEYKDGFLCEAGPNSMLVKSQAVWDYIHEVGLSDSMVEANEISNKRFLVKNGRIAAIPQSLMGGITTPLYSLGEKFRLLAEPFIKRSTLADESLTSFVSRRMGSAFLEYGISALASGIYAGNPDALSIRHAFPKVWNLEQKHGSLIGGALRMKRERKKTGEVPFKSRMISFKTGLQELATAMGDKALMKITLESTIQSISRNAEGVWQLRASTPDGNISLKAPKLILATPLDVYERLPLEDDLKRELGQIDIPEHPPLSTLVLGFDREQISHPLDGFGALFPRLEKRFGLGAIFSSTLFPGRAPEGKVSLMCFIGGVMQPENGELPTDDLVKKAVDDLRPLLGISGDPVFHSHSFWPRAIPQYNVGHELFLESLAFVEAKFPGLYLQGNFRGGPGLNDCIEGGLNFAKAQA